jgi:DNA-binding transcriptional MerR regulator
MSVGTLAIALGVRPSTLRHWESEKLLSPGRSTTGSRIYSPIDVRDARLIHQLRHAGHRIAPLRDLLPTLRAGDSLDEVLTDREHSIQTRSRALLEATITLAQCLIYTPSSDPTHVS